MPDLEMLLRDIRPAPEPAFAARLDARVADRFPGPPPRWKAPFLAVRGHVLALGTATAIAGVIAFLVIAGVRHDGSDDDAASTGGAGSSLSSEAAATPAPSTGGGSSKSFSRDSVAPAAAAPSEDRDVKTTTSLTL